MNLTTEKKQIKDMNILTVALEALVYESVEQRSTVIAERWTTVRMQLELVPVRRLHAT